MANISKTAQAMPASAIRKLVPYADAAKKSYLELEREKQWRGKSPVSVHCPLNLPYGQQLIYGDCAFNAYSLPVPPDMNNRDITCSAYREKIETRMVSFLFGDAPFVPDFRQSRWRRMPGSRSGAMRP